MSTDRFQIRKQWGITLLLLFFAALFLQRSVLTLAQTTVPSVRITSPNNGEEVGGVFTIETLATHAEGIDQVEFFINGVSVGVDKTVPYTILANALDFPEGLATIEARATSGNLSTTASAVVALSNGADLGASIIGQSPAPSAELALDGSMELYFDQPMDSTTTQNATQVKDANGNVVAGTIEWKNNRTLRFTPSNLLAPKTTYQVVVDNSAESTLGEPLVTGLSFNFTTVGDVQVSQISPAPNSDGIAPETTITVVFNRPIIPLLIAEEQNFADFLSISPTVAGTGRWINTSVYVFQPTAPLVRGQQYQLTVSADAINGLSASGAQMAADYQASFVTAEPIISRLMFSNGSYIYDGMVGMPLDNGFQLYFAQPMDRSSAEAATQLTVKNNGSVVPAMFSWSENDTILTITPTQRLAYATTYQLTVATSATAASGGTLRQPFSWYGTTVPRPSIQSTYPQNGEVASYYSSFSINFASPMDQSTFEGKVIFTPPLSADAATPYDNWYHYDTSMSFYGLASDTQYTVRILPGLRDIYGTEITEEKVVTFSTAPGQIWSSASWNLQGSYALYRPNGTTLAKATHRNVSQVTAALFSLSSAELISLNYHGTWNYTPPAGQKLWQRTQAVSLPANQNGTTPFYLTPNGENTATSLPNGFYFLSLDAPEVIEYSQQSSDDSHLIVVANAQIVLKQNNQELLAWVTDLATAEPIANVPVNIYDYAGTLLYTITTDANGLAFKSSPTANQYYGSTTHAIVNTGALFGYGSTSWDSGVDVSQFGIQSNTYFNPNEVKAYLYTDRPIYRPDQQLSFKGVLRIHDDLAYRLPTYSSVKVTISDPQGTMIYDKVHTLTDFVTFSDQLTLTESAALGQYNISVIEANSNQYLGNLVFRVAEYRKPTYEVAVNPEKDAVLSGQTLSADITANYYSGGAVVGANVMWKIKSAAYAFQPSGAYTRYSFSDSNYYDYCYRPYYGHDSFDSPWGGCNSSKIVASGTGVTTVAGRLPISITAQLTPTEGSRQYTIEATITDAANQQVSNRSDVVVHQTEFYAGIKSDRYVGRVGEAILLNGVALNWSAEPVANQPLTFQVIEERWDYSDGNYTLTQTPIFTANVTTDSIGRAMTAFTPTQGGSFKAYITGQDSQGHTTKASTYLWVAGDNYVPWREDSDYSFNLVADADQYTPGESAELLIASPYQGEATALVTVERGHIKTKEVVRLATNSTIYQLPITADMAPNVYVSVLILKGVDVNQTNPDFKVGMLELKVARNEQTLTVNITPDRLQAGPGETVNYTVQVLDYLGNPVDADLSLALADKAALALSASNSADILDFFYPDRPLGLNTNLALFNLETESAEVTPAHGGTATPMPMLTPSVPSANDGALGPGESQTSQDVRDNFVDTAYWRGILRTGAAGVATVSVQLPDNLTTWQMDGRAVSADTKVGSAEVDIVVTKPILLDPITPRFFVQGDQVQLGALVHNNKDVATMVIVSLEGTGVTILDSVGKQLIIPAGEQGLVTWDVRVENVDRVDLVFRAVSGAYSDATRPTMGTLDGQGIPVYKYEVPEVVGTSGQLLGQDIIVESIGLPSIFDDWQATQGNLKVEIAPSLAAAMTDGLGYLEHYPYECTEQLVSKFLPNVLTTRALKNAGISNPDLEAALDAQVNAALTKLASWQNSDGGWSWWHEAWYRESNPLVTAYVLFGLSSAKEAGYSVNQTMIDKGSNYLIGQLPNLNVLSDSYKLNRQAFLLFSLATAGKASSVTTYIDQLYNNREKLSLYGQAYLAQAIYLSNSADSRLNTLVNNFISKAITSASGVHWEESSNDYWNWNSDTRTTALILGVMARLQPTNPLTANAVRWLMSNRVNGRWASTQETAWTLISLTDWMVATNELNAAYDYEVALNGSLMASGTVTSANVRDPVQLNVAVGQLLYDQLNRLAIGRTAGTGNLYYSAFLNVSLPVDQVKALDQGIQISRNYYRPDAPNTPIDSAELGETIIARLTIIAPHTLHYVAIDDFYPAGLEAIDSSLLTTQQVGNPDSYTPSYGGGWNDYYWYGWRWWYFDHVELRDEKVVLSADTLPAGSYEYSYQLRAQTVGEFRAIPPTAHEFYFPDVYGRGDGSLFTVNPVGSVYTASTTRSTDSAEAATTTDATSSVGSDQITVTIKHLPTSVEMATQENGTRSSTPLIFLVVGIVSATLTIGWSRLRRHTN